MKRWLHNPFEKPNAEYQAVRSEYCRIAQRWDPKISSFPIGTTPAHDGSWHLEFASDGKMSLVVTERGNEYERKETYSLDELMYWIFSSHASARASDYELAHRHPIKDCRIIIFAKELELLEQLSQKWAERRETEQRKTLRKYPFSDLPIELRGI